MANIKSQKKRILITEKQKVNNTRKKSALKTAIKKYETAIEAKEVATATEMLPNLISMIDSAKSDGLFHKNNAARKVAKFTKLLNTIK
ncbi:MAG: 30S ribosomal protein S20 [Clostridia bacterium]